MLRTIQLNQMKPKYPVQDFEESLIGEGNKQVTWTKRALHRPNNRRQTIAEKQSPAKELSLTGNHHKVTEYLEVRYEPPTIFTQKWFILLADVPGCNYDATGIWKGPRSYVLIWLWDLHIAKITSFTFPIPMASISHHAIVMRAGPGGMPIIADLWVADIKFILWVGRQFEGVWLNIPHREIFS